jgi:hypothetical protein
VHWLSGDTLGEQRAGIVARGAEVEAVKDCGRMAAGSGDPSGQKVYTLVVATAFDHSIETARTPAVRGADAAGSR